MATDIETLTDKIARLECRIQEIEKRTSGMQMIGPNTPQINLPDLPIEQYLKDIKCGDE